jgi:prepilin-type N-terminal cleavage/methylation domain-containing protein
LFWRTGCTAVRMASELVSRQRGFSLIEILVAIALLIIMAVSLAHLFSVGRQANDRARVLSVASVLAAEKMEQLRSLSWSFDVTGMPSSDTSADVTSSPERPTGGGGLRPSPADALDRNVDGYCDFLDAAGSSLGTGTSPPLNTSYIRRWSVAPLAADPANGLVVQVRVVSRSAGDVPAGRSAAGEARLVSIRARTAS